MVAHSSNTRRFAPRRTGRPGVPANDAPRRSPAEEIRERERQRLAGEIHDGITQLVVGALCESRSLRRSLLKGGQDWPEKLRGLQDLLQLTIGELRQAVYDLYPVGLEELGLAPALQKYVAFCEASLGLRCQMRVKGEPRRAGKAVEVALYRIAQEALQNAYQHSGAGNVKVELVFQSSRIRLAVQDDGNGMTASADLPGKLWTMRDRVAQIGGKLRTLVVVGGGTKVNVVVPLSETPAADEERNAMMVGGFGGNGAMGQGAQ